MQYRKWTDNNAEKPTHSWGSWGFFSTLFNGRVLTFCMSDKTSSLKTSPGKPWSQFFLTFSKFFKIEQTDQFGADVTDTSVGWQETIRRKEIGENFLLRVIVGNKCIFVSLEVSTEIAADALYSEKQRFMVTVCYKWQTGLNEIIQRAFHNQPGLQVWLIIFKTHEGTISLQYHVSNISKQAN